MSVALEKSYRTYRKPTTKTVIRSVRIPEDWDREYVRVAGTLGISVSHLIYMILEEGFEKPKQP